MVQTLHPHLQALINAFETLSPQTLDRLDRLYAPDVHFSDPFNDLRGRDAVKRVFAHMYKQVDSPRFEVTAAAGEGEGGFLGWSLHYVAHGKPQARCIQGGTWLHFNALGLVDRHQDHWDPVKELYSDLPLLGGLLRAIGRRLAAPPG
jgi:steroid Delta-isomerase